MIGKDYIQLQNQGNIISNVRLLYEMLNSDGYADSQGYFTKKDVAEIACNALIITTGSKIGDEVSSVINSAGDESRNSPLQNAKARMQLLRVLGLVSTDYGSEIYAITHLGELMVGQVLAPNPNVKLLRELFLHISSGTEIYEHNCEMDFNCMLGYGIMYAFSRLDYMVATDEMPLLTAYDIREIDDFVEVAKEYRVIDKPLPNTVPHFPKTSQDTPLKNVSNLTRSINQILKVCGIIETKVKRIGKKNYYVCTAEGKKFVEEVTTQFHKLKFITAYQFRKLNNITKQKEVCFSCHQNILVKGGLLPQSSFISEYERDVFSPYQMIPETNVEWFFGGRIRKHPDAQDKRILVINSQINLNNIRVKDLFFDKEQSQINLNHKDQSLINRWTSQETDMLTFDELASIVCEEYFDASKDEFYPLVHSLLRIIGLNCEGEVGRYDALCKFDEHLIPIEIKSRTETPTYNMKGLRQAVENKIMAYNSRIKGDIEFASIVVGYAHPSADQDIRNFIDSALENFGIRIIVSDLSTLVKMAIRVLRDKVSVDLKSLLTSHGVLCG